MRRTRLLRCMNAMPDTRSVLSCLHMPARIRSLVDVSTTTPPKEPPHSAGLSILSWSPRLLHQLHRIRLARHETADATELADERDPLALLFLMLEELPI